MESIVWIIIIVFGILQIILFFKIWGMTNDIEKIKNKYCRTDNVKKAGITGIKSAVVKMKNLGQKKEALEFLDNMMQKRLDGLFDELHTSDTPIEELDKHWSNYVRGYTKMYAYLGEEIPEGYKNFSFKTYNEDLSSL